jgi:subtilase family serine protease
MGRDALPDLCLRNITYLPQKPRIGQGVVVTGEVANAGNATSEPCNLSIFVDINVTPAATVPMPPLGPGGSRGFVISWNSSGLSAALHRMRLVVDPDYAIADANQTNNTFSWSMEFWGIVDLVLGNLTISPPSPLPGDTVHFSVTVVNTGTLRCNSANLTLKIGGAEADRKQLLTLSAGGQLGSSLIWSAAGMVPGSYDFEVMVIPGPGENDSDDANNMLQGQLVVQPVPPMPDLRIASVTLVPSGPVHDGDTIMVVVNVENAGNKDANESYLDMKLETASGGVINFTDSPVAVPAIAAGGSATVNASQNTQNYMAGDYRLRVVADFRGDMVESNESNNMMLVELSILGALPKLPKLGVEELILEGKLEQDQKLNIFVVINNTGEADAMNVVVNFTVDGRALGSATPISVIGRQSNRTASWLWVPAAGPHIIGVTVSAEGTEEQSIFRSVTVPRAPSVASPYMLAAGICIIAVVLGAVIVRAIGSTRRPMPRLRLIDEEEAGSDMEGDEQEDPAGEREA